MWRAISRAVHTPHAVQSNVSRVTIKGAQKPIAHGRHFGALAGAHTFTAASASRHPPNTHHRTAPVTTSPSAHTTATWSASLRVLSTLSASHSFTVSRTRLSSAALLPARRSAVRLFFSDTSSAATPPTPPTPAPTVGSSPELYDASHLLSGLLEDNKQRLRCLEVDDSGNYRHVEFSRAELSSMLDLHPRDLRFLDSSMRNLPSILARRRVIIVNLEMFKALITADRVLMFDPWYPHVQSVVQPLQASVMSGGELFEGKPVPFEFIALEHILLTVCRNLEDRFDLYISSLEPLLSSSSSEIDTNDTSLASTLYGSTPSFHALVAEGSGSTLMHLLQLKNGLTSFEVTLRETGGAMRDLLETDEDMAQMYLTAKKNGHVISSQDHGEVEVILETYFRKVDELENEVEQNVKSITLTEEHIQIRLDSNRNSMMRLELLASISTLGMTTAALGAALFGMNLPSHLEGSPYAFWCVTGVFLLLAGGVVRKGLALCRRRGIHLLHIEKEPALKFPHMAHYAHMPHYAQTAHAEALNGSVVNKINKQRRLAKLQAAGWQQAANNLHNNHCQNKNSQTSCHS